MKGPKTGRISTQNDGVLEELYNQTYDKIMGYISDTEDVLDDQNTLSAYTLYDILKDYYSDLDNVMNADSKELKRLIEGINSYIANGYKRVVSVKNNNKLLHGFNDLLSKIKENKQLSTMNNRYLDIKFVIRKNSTNAIFDIIKDGKYKKVIICRDLNNQDIHYGENSEPDYDVINFAYDKLMNLFDTIDAYRESLPEQIEEDMALDDLACRTYEYARYTIPFKTEVVKGEIFVNSNGYVDVEMEMPREINPFYYNQMNNYSKKLQDLMREKSVDLLKKVPVDVDTLESPIKEIVIDYLTNEQDINKLVG